MIHQHTHQHRPKREGEKRPGGGGGQEGGKEAKEEDEQLEMEQTTLCIIGGEKAVTT